MQQAHSSAAVQHQQAAPQQQHQASSSSYQQAARSKQHKSPSFLKILLRQRYGTPYRRHGWWNDAIDLALRMDFRTFHYKITCCSRAVGGEECGSWVSKDFTFHWHHGVSWFRHHGLLWGGCTSVIAITSLTAERLYEALRLIRRSYCSQHHSWSSFSTRCINTNTARHCRKWWAVHWCLIAPPPNHPVLCYIQTAEAKPSSLLVGLATIRCIFRCSSLLSAFVSFFTHSSEYKEFYAAGI